MFPVKKIVNVAGIDINIYDVNVGISCSGGTDSSLLTYILLNNTNDHLDLFVTSTWAFPNRTQKVLEVIKIIEHLTGNSNYSLHVTEVEENNTDHLNLFVTPMQMQKDNKISIVCTGLTANPSEQLLPNRVGITKRDAVQGRPKPVINENNFYLPFINIDKRKIYEMYKELDLLENLFPATYSCTDSTSLDHCGECWWCAERMWGFGKLI